MSKKVYGYVILHNETKERFPTNRSSYDSKEADAGGFNRVTDYGYFSHDARFGHLSRVKFKDQTEYGVYPLVAYYD
jgi:hypothetical protein